MGSVAAQRGRSISELSVTRYNVVPNNHIPDKGRIRL